MNNLLLRGEGNMLEGDIWQLWSDSLTIPERKLYEHLVHLRDDGVNEMSDTAIQGHLGMTSALLYRTLDRLQELGLISLDENE